MIDMNLLFHPWIVKRTLLHEYFSRSWGMFGAAQRTGHSGVAAMLTGLSFELAIKALLVLVGRERHDTHEITKCLKMVPELRPLLEGLWGSDLEFLIQFIDQDINSSQMRYGAAGSRKDKSTKLIAATTVLESTTWTEAVSEMYDELMCSIGTAIWENYPNVDREGRPIQKGFGLFPVFETEHPVDVYPELNRSLFGIILLPEVNGIDTGYGAIIPIEGREKDGNYWVRVRLGRETAVDQEIIQKSGSLKLGNFRWVGMPVEGFVLRLHEAWSTLQSVRPRA